MIAFDGLYSFISLVLALLAIATNNFINKSDFNKYPFGKASLEPILVIIKSLVLLIMCIITIFSSINEILSGGNNVDSKFALGYSIISSLACIFIYFYMKKASKNLKSDIVMAESNQWFMDCLLSVGVLVGFLISISLGILNLDWISSYVDPAMVILSSLVFLKMPIDSIIDSFKEIISSKADDKINYDINLLVKWIEDEYEIRDSITRVAKVGRELRIEIDFVVSKNSKIRSVDDMDKVREIIDKNTNHFELKKWMNVSFTKNRKWVI